MTDTITEDEIREKLSKHHGGDNARRDLVRNRRIDDHGTVGSVVYSLSGSPPKGYAIAVPGLKKVSLYDAHGKRFRILDQTVVEELEELSTPGGSMQGGAFRKVTLPSGPTIYEGDEVLVREKLVYGDEGPTFWPGTVFGIDRMEFGDGDVEVWLKDAPLDSIVLEALDEHFAAGEMVLAESKER